MGDAGALRERGNEAFNAREYEQAIAAYTESLSLDPQQHLCYSNRSAAHMKLGNAEEALRDAQRCVELAPAFPKGYSRQAAALQALKRWEEAVEVCERGIVSAPDENLRKMLGEVRNRHFRERMQGTWNGRVSEALGGYDQEMEFMDGGKVRVGVLGRSIVGSYWLDCSHMPHHLSIQVPVPDMPGVPPPPPVPYIVRLDGDDLHLCCAYMTMERPTSFDGPGFCLMKRGAATAEDDSAGLDSLSEDEKMLACTRELTSALPGTKLEEPKNTDSDDVARDKLMAQVRFESSMFALQKRFGEDLMKQVLAAAKGDGSVPACLATSTELKQLREKFRLCGLLEDPPPASDARSGGDASPASPPPPVAAPSPATAPAAPPAEERRVDAATTTAPSPPPSEPAGAPSSTPSSLCLGIVLSAAAAAVIGGFVWQQRSRRR
mmetsp:Transcript_68106/g.197378  ORF Transcript_68106/g.197378 Transcript_68106/m.197378 type:complete len:435 (-) Transcript_68106:80-1384(-)